MSQLMNQGITDIPSPSDSRSKRKRGRPRKDDTQPQAAADIPVLRPVTFCTPGDASVASKGKDTVQAGADLSLNDDYNKDEMVGQVVTGVLENAFDAGYFLRVQVGDSGVYMRGVVFKEGCVVPVTPENDIAPYAKMYTRRDLPVPVSFVPEADKTTENDVNPRQESDSNTRDVGQGGTNMETVENLSAVDLEKNTGIAIVDEEEKEKEKEKDQEKNYLSAVDLEKNTGIAVLDEEVKENEKHQENAHLSAVNLEKNSGITVVDEGEKEKEKEQDKHSEVSENVANKPKDEKIETEQSTQAVPEEHNTENQIEEEKDGDEEISEQKMKEDCSERVDLEESIDLPAKIQKTDEVTAMVTTCSNGQAQKESAELGIPVTEAADATVADKEICKNSGFQINMDNTEADGLVSEQPSEFSAMETE